MVLLLLGPSCLQIVSDQPGTENLPHCALGAAGQGVSTLYPAALPAPLAYQPGGIALGQDCSLYVADSLTIRRIDPQGAATTVLAPSSPPQGSEVAVNPGWLAIDGNGNIYIADAPNNRVCKLDKNGVLTTLAGQGSPGFADGSGGPTGSAQFNNPQSVAVDPSGNVYVADSANSRIRKIDGSGNVTTFAGNGKYGPLDGTGGVNGTAELFGPAGVAVDAKGNVYVADTLNQRICKIDSAGNLTTVAGAYQPGAPGMRGDVDGTGGSARFSSPAGLAVTALGIIYVADVGNNRIRKIDANGNVTTLAGNGSLGVVDGTLGATGTASFSQLSELILDGDGNLYAADDDQLRKIVP